VQDKELKDRKPAVNRSREAVCLTRAKLEAEAAVRMAKLTEKGRQYTLQVKVTDPEGRDVFTLTRLTRERDLQDQGNTIPEIDEILELLIEAAKEYVLPLE
jgi:hypothetical protein